MRFLLTIFTIACAVASNLLAATPAEYRRTDLDGDRRKPEQGYVEVLPNAIEFWKLRSALPDPRSTPVRIEMVYIPAGEFLMGSPDTEKDRSKSEGPQRPVKIKAFWMATFELKREVLWLLKQDKARMPAQGNELAKEMDAVMHPHGPYMPFYRDDVSGTFSNECPIAGITQFHAQQICRWLTLRTGRLYRLPTEAEWEYAARAGTKSRYFFGDDEKKLSDYAWFANAEPCAQPVGRKKPNPWGLYDIYGNVAEWTLDGWTKDYSEKLKSIDEGSPPTNPWTRRSKPEAYGVIRGGDWTIRAPDLRSASRARFWDIDPTTAEFLPAWWNTSDEGIRVGLRVVSPADSELEKKADLANSIPQSELRQGYDLKRPAED